MRGGVLTVQGLLGRVHASGSSITICMLAVSPRMVDSMAVMKVTSSGHLNPLFASTTKPAIAVASLEEKKTKHYAFQHLIHEKPSTIPRCPGAPLGTV